MNLFIKIFKILIDNELQLLYQTFLDQVQKYIDLDEIYAIQYDFPNISKYWKKKLFTTINLETTQLLIN